MLNGNSQKKRRSFCLKKDAKSLAERGSILFYGNRLAERGGQGMALGKAIKGTPSSLDSSETGDLLPAPTHSLKKVHSAHPLA